MLSEFLQVRSFCNKYIFKVIHFNMKKKNKMIVIPSYVCKYFYRTSVFLQGVADIHNPRYLLSELGWNRFLQFFECASKPLYHFHSKIWSKNLYMTCIGLTQRRKTITFSLFLWKNDRFSMSNLFARHPPEKQICRRNKKAAFDMTR